jgi:thiol-disulfide isomerase/thioredoxin
MPKNKYINFNISTMKVLFIIFFCIGQINAQSIRHTYITGIVKGFNNQIQFEDISGKQDLSIPNSERIFVPDSIGKFSIDIKINIPSYFRIGRNTVYFSPGKANSIYIDFNNPGLAKFEGYDEAANNYLKKTPFPKGGSFLESGDNIKKTVKETIDTIMILEEARKYELNSLIGVSPYFKRIEFARINADILNSLYNISGYFFWGSKLDKDSLVKLKENCEQMIGPYSAQYSANFIHSEFLTLPVYRNILSHLFKEAHGKIALKDSVTCTDWLLSQQLSYKINDASTKAELQEYKNKIQEIKTFEYKNLLTKKINSFQSFGNGNTAKDFIALDSNNHQNHLLQFKGKVIYIDLWATWCSPCLEEMPYLDSLKNHFSQNADIVFLSLSVDDLTKVWKQNIKKRNAQGIQWIIPREKLNSYLVTGIPRIIIIDKAFQIVAMNGKLPSDKTVINYLNGILDL